MLTTVPACKALVPLAGANSQFGQADKGKHRKMRELLQPAMLPGYVNKLLPSFLAAAQQLCAALAQEHGQPVNMQYLAKCASLDIIGLTSFRHDFGALRQVCWSPKATCWYFEERLAFTSRTLAIVFVQAECPFSFALHAY